MAVCTLYALSVAHARSVPCEASMQEVGHPFSKSFIKKVAARG
jgi:hypothetical protein